MRQLPDDLANYPHAEISQGYLVSLNDGLQVRLRKSAIAIGSPINEVSEMSVRSGKWN